jgi:hypothetical protein
MTDINVIDYDVALAPNVSPVDDTAVSVASLPDPNDQDKSLL